jgi:hypothetical protein
MLSVLMLKLAVPPLKVPVPSVIVPSLKITMPVGVPAPGLVTNTVAVKVTDCPKTEGLTEEVSVVVAAAGLTTWLKSGEEPPLKLASPP